MLLALGVLPLAALACQGICARAPLSDGRHATHQHGAALAGQDRSADATTGVRAAAARGCDHVTVIVATTSPMKTPLGAADTAGIPHAVVRFLAVTSPTRIIEDGSPPGGPPRSLALRV